VSKTYSVIEINGTRYDAMTGKIISKAHRVKTHTTGFIDGVVKPAASATRGSISQRSIKGAAQTVHRKTQKSRTLMRGGVKKPAKKSPAQATQTGHHLKAVSKHSQVKRFGHVAAAKQPATAGHKVATMHSQESTPHTNPSVPRPLPSLVTSATHKDLDRMLDRALIEASAHKNIYSAKAKHRPLKQLGFLPKWLTMAFVLASLAIIAVVAIK
jgi:hypothetical protein